MLVGCKDNIFLYNSHHFFLIIFDTFLQKRGKNTKKQKSIKICQEKILPFSKKTLPLPLENAIMPLENSIQNY